MQHPLDATSPDLHIALERIAIEAVARTCFLHLEKLKLAALPNEISELKHLEVLFCSDTQVKDLSLLAALPALRSLYFGHTPVSDLSPLIGLKALHSLDCSGTAVSDLSPLAGLTALESLEFRGTQVKDLSALAELTALRTLLCSGTQVKDLSPLAGVTKLQYIDCSHTGVCDLSTFSGLAVLHWLDCSESHVENLLPLKGATSLYYLKCDNTNVSDLSPLAGLVTLNWLDCSQTQVNDLSPMAGLVALQKLDCSYTTISDLSPLAGLTGLEILNCSHTEVKDLSPLLGLIGLQELAFDGCTLNIVPYDLFKQPSLRGLSLYETRIPGIPGEILSQNFFDGCLDSVRAYLQGLESGSVESTDAKLLILGNGRIGKTQICLRLSKDEYDPSIESTHGIIVSSASVRQPEDDSSVQLHLWDFGGQDIYHGTHALFMRTHAIFMLVWIPEAEEVSEYKHGGLIFRNHPLDYWLSYIRNLSGLDNPTLVVQTRCDRPEDEIRHIPVADGALEGFHFCKLLQYSSLENRGRGALNEALSEALDWLRKEQGSVLIGKGWMRVKLRLEAMRNADAALQPEQRQHRTLSQETFHQLCAEGKGDVGSPEYLLQYLHNCGIVFYRHGLFQERIILEQGWALEAIYTVFHREKCYKHLRHSRGRFYRSLLEDLAWQAYSEEEQKLFLGMMLSCGVCFIHQKGDEARGIEPIYVAPDLLPEKTEVELEIAERWDFALPTEEAIFEYELHQPGLLRSFVSRIGNEAGLNALYWKGGMFLYEHTCRSRALIEQETQGGWKGVIHLQTQNGDARGLLALLTKRLMEEQEQWGVRHLNSTSAAPSQREINVQRTSPESVFLEPRFTWEPGSTPDYCISYAWGDESEEGKEREDIVNKLCAEAEARGIRILRDKNDLGVGDSIPAFMQSVGRGRRVFIVLSQKYLQSPNCMFELWEIWRNSRLDKDEFLSRARVYALPDARILGMDAQIAHVKYWNEKFEKYTSELRLLDGPLLAKYSLIKQYIHNLGAILSAIESIVLPCTFDELVKYGLDDLTRPPLEAD